MHVFGFTLGCFTCYESPRYCPNIVLIVSAGIREFFEHCRNVTKCGCHLVKDFAVNSLTSVLCKHLFICFVYLGILVYTLKLHAFYLLCVCMLVILGSYGQSVVTFLFWTIHLFFSPIILLKPLSAEDPGNTSPFPG